jgi:hypothetical protein
MVVFLCLGIISQAYTQAFRLEKKKVGVSAESYGLGADNFGILNGEGKEVTDIKQVKLGERVSLAFYNLTGYTVEDERSHIRMNMSVINLSDNQIIIAAQKVLDEKVKVEDLKEDYIYGYMTLSSDLIKGKTYLIKLQVNDVATGSYIELSWKFKANFK